MEYTITKHDTTADLELIYNPEDIENAFVQAYEKAAKKAKIDGFRPGKAPLAIVKKVLGESVTQDALNILLSNSLENIQSKLEFKTFGDPKIEIQKYERKEKLIAKASYELAPETQLGDFKNIPLTTYNLEVTDENIQEHLTEIRYELAKVSIKEPEETIESSDLVRMEIISKDVETGDTLYKRDSQIHYMGRSKSNSELDKNLLGLKVDEEKNFEISNGESNSENNENPKKVSYFVKIYEIFNITLPELDDSMANEWSEEFKNLEELKSRLKENSRIEAQNSLDQMYFDKILHKIIENSTYRIPSSMIKTEADQVYHNTLHDLKFGHIPMDKFAEAIGKELSEVQNSFEQRAVTNIKKILTIYKIAELEQLSVSKEELESSFETYRRNKDPEKLKEIDLNRVVRNLHENILIDKVYRFLYENSYKTSEDLNIDKLREVLS